jgi:hypothetical protein
MPALPFPDSDDELLATRLDKLRQLREAGLDPFAIEKFDRTHGAADIVNAFDTLEGTTVRTAGRVVAIRVMGKAQFMHIEDGRGRIQIYLKKDNVGEEAYARLELVDSGDFIGVEGEVRKTRTGEVTVFVSGYQILAKALRPSRLANRRTKARNTARCPILKSVTAIDTWILRFTPKCVKGSVSAAALLPVFARQWNGEATWRWKRPFCNVWPAAQPHARSALTTMRSTLISTFASASNWNSNASSSVVSRGCMR